MYVLNTSAVCQSVCDLFVRDLLHEWELGVWKTLMTHLVTILWAEGSVR